MALQMYLQSILSSQMLFDYEDVLSFLETKKHIKQGVRKSIINNRLDQSKVKALYDYDTKDESELAFKKDDIIVVLQKDPSGWYYGHNIQDKEVNGFFPKTYVSENINESAAEQLKKLQTTTTTTTPTPTTITSTTATPQPQSKSRKAKVMFDYMADSDKEISISVDEIVDVLYTKAGWCFISKENSSEGFVPLEYLQFL